VSATIAWSPDGKRIAYTATDPVAEARKDRDKRYGEFEVIFVRYTDLDLSPLLSEPHANVRSMKVVDCLGGGRSAALWAGLSAITGDYFAMLDDDDWLFSNHFEKLFQPFPQAPKSRFFAYSSSISHYAEPKPLEGGHEDHRSLLYLEKNTPDLSSVYSMFASNSFALRGIS
jgi:hypothetical protein